MKKLVIANWKTNPKTAREAVLLAHAVEKSVRHVSRKVEVVLAPPFPFLSLITYHSSRHYGARLAHSAGGTFKLGAQDVFWERGGAYTGEVSASQLKSLGVSYVIVGHSERRSPLTGGGETSEMVRKKMTAVLKTGMRAVLCVGEEERKKETAFPPLVREELHEGLRGVNKSLLRNLIVVYEPPWAISSHKHAKPDTAQNVFEMSILIRRELVHLIGKKRAMRTPILYGGSVDEKNAVLFVREGRVDGLLVGGASLHPKNFIGIVRSIAEI